MRYRRLGAGGPEVPVLGFGAWALGGGYGPVDAGEAAAAVGRALDLGMTLFDTAPAYGAGRSEAALGRALGARRREAFLVTKCGLPTRAGQKPGRDGRYAALVADAEHSLRALGTDHVDLLLHHWPDPETPVAESLRALEDLRRAGKARYVGVSNYPGPLLAEAARHAPVVANQVGYSLLDRRWEAAVFPAARALGVGIMAYGPLAHGLLAGEVTAATRFAPDDWRGTGDAGGQPLFAPAHLPRNLAVAAGVAALAGELSTTPAALALAWALRDPLVAVALCGLRRPEQVEENLGALAALDALTPAVLARLEALAAGAAGRTDAPPG